MFEIPLAALSLIAVLDSGQPPDASTAGGRWERIESSGSCWYPNIPKEAIYVPKYDRVLVVGGNSRDVAVFDVMTSQWDIVGVLDRESAFQSVMLFSEDMVFITDEGNDGTVYTYNMMTGVFKRIPVTGTTVWKSARVSDDTAVLVDEECHFKRYNPISDVWTDMSQPNGGYSYCKGNNSDIRIFAGMDDGKILLYGMGPAEEYLTEVYNLSDNTWEQKGAKKYNFKVSSSVRLKNGDILTTGGYDDSGGELYIQPEAEIYKADSGSWVETSRMLQARVMHKSLLLEDGRVLAFGGLMFGQSYSYKINAEFYYPDTDTWMEATWGCWVGNIAGATLISDGKVFVVGVGSRAPNGFTEVFLPLENGDSLCKFDGLVNPCSQDGSDGGETDVSVSDGGEADISATDSDINNDANDILLDVGADEGNPKSGASGCSCNTVSA